jgi:hypothetical protein
VSQKEHNEKRYNKHIILIRLCNLFSFIFLFLTYFAWKIYENTDKQVFWHVRVDWCVYISRPGRVRKPVCQYSHISWKITILRQKIIVFTITEGGAKHFGVFREKNHDFTPKKPTDVYISVDPDVSENQFVSIPISVDPDVSENLLVSIPIQNDLLSNILRFALKICFWADL